MSVKDEKRMTVKLSKQDIQVLEKMATINNAIIICPDSISVVNGKFNQSGKIGSVSKSGYYKFKTPYTFIDPWRIGDVNQFLSICKTFKDGEYWIDCYDDYLIVTDGKMAITSFMVDREIPIPTLPVDNTIKKVLVLNTNTSFNIGWKELERISKTQNILKKDKLYVYEDKGVLAIRIASQLEKNSLHSGNFIVDADKIIENNNVSIKKGVGINLHYESLLEDDYKITIHEKCIILQGIETEYSVIFVNQA